MFHHDWYRLHIMIFNFDPIIPVHIEGYFWFVIDSLILLSAEGDVRHGEIICKFKIVNFVELFFLSFTLTHLWTNLDIYVYIYNVKWYADRVPVNTILEILFFFFFLSKGWKRVYLLVFVKPCNLCFVFLNVSRCIWHDKIIFQICYLLNYLLQHQIWYILANIYYQINITETNINYEYKIRKNRIKINKMIHELFRFYNSKP